VRLTVHDIAKRLAHAAQHHQAGRLVEAEALYRSILGDAPRQPHVLHLLGVLSHQLGRTIEAIDLIRQALDLHGPEPLFHTNLSAAYLAAARLADAADHARQAIRLKPDLPDAHNNLGVALRRLGKLEEAEIAFSDAVRLDPRHVDARTNLGAALQQQGNLTGALVHLEEAIRLAPASAQAHNDLGGTLIAVRRPETALDHLRRAILLKPDFADAHNNLGVALRNTNQFGDSLESFRTAVRLKPAYTRARINLAHALQLLGRIDEALAEYQEVLRLEPDNALALNYLSNLAAHGYVRLSQDQKRLLEELAARPDLPTEDLCRLHFALARLSDKAGAYDEAFVHCARGNELRKEFDRRRGQVFDPALHRDLVDRLIATFTPAYFERVAGFGIESDLPIFVVGMMRSGTTLVEQILASHPHVHGAGELPDVEALIARLVNGGSKQQSLAPPSSQPRAAYPNCLAGLDAATARTLAEDYIERLRRQGGAAARVVDKLPANHLHLGLIATLLPRARIIHCRRDALDTCLSCYFQNFTDPHPFAFDLGQLGQYYREYERLMARWAKVLPVPIFDLPYESLTADQEAVSRRLLAFCGLEWDDRCLHFHETNRPIRTASALQVRQPMYRTSVGRWKHYAAHLKPLLEALAGETDR
jgi:tetratricopeptide (TPR) repeat protein